MGGRLRRRVGYLWNEMHPDGVELLSAALSLTFAALLLYRRESGSILDREGWYVALCGAAGLGKVAGVLLEWLWLRVAGLLLGVVFWVMLAYVLLRAGNSITWLCFMVLALAQLWAVRRNVEGGR